MFGDDTLTPQMGMGRLSARPDDRPERTQLDF
jgi:hypothetical protein